MKITFDKYRILFLPLVLLLVTSAISACATPTARETDPPADKEITFTPTSELTITGTWQTYRNEHYNFQFSYPSQGQMMESLEGRSGRIDLTFILGTNLQEKYVQIDVQENPAECSSPLSQGYTSGALQQGQETINGIDFQTASAGEIAAGNIYDWKAYTTTWDDTCISISFVLHATNPNNYTTPLTEYDKASEAAVFPEIMSTFQFTD